MEFMREPGQRPIVAVRWCIFSQKMIALLRLSATNSRVSRKNSLITIACAALGVVAIFIVAGQRDSGTAGSDLGGPSPRQADPSLSSPPQPIPKLSGDTSSPQSASQAPTPVGTFAADVSNASPSAALTNEPGGQVVSARIQVGVHEVTAAPNDLGLFPRTLIGLEETAQVAVSYPGGAPGDLVTVQAEDGGLINGGPPIAQMRLDEAKSLRFAFTSTLEGGIYRVTLRNGFDEKRLEFWGGPEPTGVADPSTEP